MADTQTAPNSLPLPPVERLGHGSFTQGLTMNDAKFEALTYDCPNDGVPKRERRAHQRGPKNEQVEQLFNGFHNAIENAVGYQRGYLTAMRDDFASFARAALASAQAASAEPVAREMMLPPGATTKERFRVSDDGLGIWDEDFTFDANLKISGDFATEDDKRAYARELVALLNTTPAPAASAEPVATTDMVLHCPACGMQHIDAPEPHEADENEPKRPGGLWDNRPHRSHL